VINRTLHNIREAIKNWSLKHAEGPHAKFWLALFSFFEASFFPIPPDAILIGILLSNEARRWAHYAFIATVASIFGGLFSYGIGFFAYDIFGVQIITFYNLEETFVNIGGLFSNNAFWAIFTAALTPLPYKAFVLAAGFFKINIFVFIFASIVGRGLRFFAIAYLIKRYGKYVGDTLYRYFNIVSVVVVIAVLMLVVSFV